MAARVPRVVDRLLAMGVPEDDAAMTDRIEQLRAEQKEREERWPSPSYVDGAIESGRVDSSDGAWVADRAALTEALDGWEMSDKALEVQSRLIVELQRDYEDACSELAKKDNELAYWKSLAPPGSVHRVTGGEHHRINITNETLNPQPEVDG